MLPPTCRGGTCHIGTPLLQVIGPSPLSEDCWRNIAITLIDQNPAISDTPAFQSPTLPFLTVVADPSRTEHPFEEERSGVRLG